MFLGTLAKQIFGSANDRRLKGYRPKVAAINALEPEMLKLSDEELAARTPMFREALSQGASLEDLAGAGFRHRARGGPRVLGAAPFRRPAHRRHGPARGRHRGDADRRRLKTLVATLACYLNALAGKGVHVVTVNDYLARRDAEWMGQVYGFLGPQLRHYRHGIDDADRRAGYAADITYGTNNEFGFDYLRDNMRYELGDGAARA